MQRIFRPLVLAAVVAAIGLVLILLMTRPLGEVDSGTGAPGAGAQPGAAPSAAPEPRPEGTSSPEKKPRPTGQLSVSTAGWETDFDIANVDLSEINSGGPGKDGIPAIDEPKFESLADAGSWLSPNVPVIALEVNGEARAYPLAILMWHEIVNDTLGGVPVVVTFCPLCNTSLVFEREIDGVVYDFGTTGNLRFSDLVMYDRQTESWWQQATGEAIVGTLTGTKLPFIPSQVISLEDFAASHPGGQVLSRDTGHAREYGRNPYVGYDTVDQQPFLFRGVVDGRLGPMERVVTVTVDDEAVAYPYSELEKVGVVHDEVGGVSIVVLWQPGVSSALDAPVIEEGRDVGATGVFLPTIDGKPMTFEQSDDGSIIDTESGSTWSITGQATDGPLDGERLKPAVHGDHFWFAWAAFEPETRIWTPGSGSGGDADAPARDQFVAALPGSVGGLAVQWTDVDTRRFYEADLRNLDAADFASVMTRSGAAPGKFRMALGIAADETRGPLWLSAFSASTMRPANLAELIDSMGLIARNSGRLQSELVVVGDALLLLSSNDRDFHAAALMELMNE